MARLAGRHGRAALSIPLCLWLAACATGARKIRPDLSAMDPGTLNVGRAIAEAVPPTRRDPPHAWAAFADPQLDRLIADMALAPTITAAEARLRRAEADARVAVADRAPRLDLGASTTAERFPDRSVYPEPYAGSVGSRGSLLANARYALDFWGRERDLAMAQGARADAARAEAADAALLLQAAVTDAYVRLAAAWRIRDVAAEGLARREGVLALLGQRTRAGLATEIDAVAAREAIAGTRDEIARLDGEIASHRYQIAALLGRDPAYAERIERPAIRLSGDPAPISAIPAELLAHRPDVTAAIARVEAAAREIGAARAAFYPNVDLVAFAGLQSLGLANLLRPGSIAAGVGPAVTLPIFDGGRLRANLRGKTADYDAAVAAYDAAMTRALAEVAEGVTTLANEHERRRQAIAAVDDWNRVVALHRIRESRGLSSALDRLAAETALLLAQRRAAEADARVASAQIALIRALGGAWTPTITQQGQRR